MRWPWQREKPKPKPKLPMPRVEMVPVYRITVPRSKPIHVYRLGKTLGTLTGSWVKMAEIDTLTLTDDFGEQTAPMNRDQVEHLTEQMMRLYREDARRAEWS
jgi:hypothetical protein